MCHTTSPCGPVLNQPVFARKSTTVDRTSRVLFFRLSSLFGVGSRFSYLVLALGSVHELRHGERHLDLLRNIVLSRRLDRTSTRYPPQHGRRRGLRNGLNHFFALLIRAGGRPFTVLSGSKSISFISSTRLFAEKAIDSLVLCD
jgi:hypothetical protein